MNRIKNLSLSELELLEKKITNVINRELMGLSDYGLYKAISSFGDGINLDREGVNKLFGMLNNMTEMKYNISMSGSLESVVAKAARLGDVNIIQAWRWSEFDQIGWDDKEKPARFFFNPTMSCFVLYVPVVSSTLDKDGKPSIFKNYVNFTLRYKDVHDPLAPATIDSMEAMFKLMDKSVGAVNDKKLTKYSDLLSQVKYQTRVLSNEEYIESNFNKDENDIEELLKGSIEASKQYQQEWENNEAEEVLEATAVVENTEEEVVAEVEESEVETETEDIKSNLNEDEELESHFEPIPIKMGKFDSEMTELEKKISLYAYQVDDDYFLRTSNEVWSFCNEEYGITDKSESSYLIALERLRAEVKEFIEL